MTVAQELVLVYGYLLMTVFNIGKLEMMVTLRCDKMTCHVFLNGAQDGE